MRGSPLGLVAILAIAGACAQGSPSDGAPARITAEIDVDPSPGASIAIGADAVWVVASTSFEDPSRPDPRHAIVRIDPQTAAVEATVTMPHQMVAVAAGPEGVWAVGTASIDAPTGTIVRIDPDTNTIATRITLDDIASSPADVAVGEGGVWVADSTGDRVIRVDPETGAVVATIAVDGRPSSISVAGGRVWVNKPGTGEVRPIDPDTDRPLPAIATGSFPDIVEAGGAGVWVAVYSENDVLELDPDRLEISRSVDFETAPSRIAVGTDRVAVAETEGQRLTIIRNGTAEAVLEGRRIVALTLHGSEVWAVDQGVRRILRIRLPT